MSECAYINIPPTTLELLDLGRGIYSLCESRIGLETFAPCISPDSDKPNVSRGEIVEAREHPLSYADLVILYLGSSSREVFDDLRVAVEMAKSCIVLCEKGKSIENPLIGVIGDIEAIEFGSHEDALDQIEIAILKWQWDFVIEQK